MASTDVRYAHARRSQQSYVRAKHVRLQEIDGIARPEPSAIGVVQEWLDIRDARVGDEPEVRQVRETGEWADFVDRVVAEDEFRQALEISDPYQALDPLKVGV